MGEVNRIISANDQMYKIDPRGYFNWGQRALDCINLAMTAAGKKSVHAILDLPSGHGRVLRTLAAAFPEAKITACDLDRDGVDFCAKTFGAVPAYSSERPDQIRLPGKFDLIWCGSLLTHVDAPRWREFLSLFRSALTPGGILVFTTNGRRVAFPMKGGYLDEGLGKKAAAGVVEAWSRQGFGYADYFEQRHYGVSLSSPSWVCSRVCEVAGLRLVTYTERGWYNYQDSVGCLRTNENLTIG